MAFLTRQGVWVYSFKIRRDSLLFYAIKSTYISTGAVYPFGASIISVPSRWGILTRWKAKQNNFWPFVWTWLDRRWSLKLWTKGGSNHFLSPHYRILISLSPPTYLSLLIRKTNRPLKSPRKLDFLKKKRGDRCHRLGITWSTNEKSIQTEQKFFAGIFCLFESGQEKVEMRFIKKKKSFQFSPSCPFFGLERGKKPQNCSSSVSKKFQFSASL